MLAPSTIAQKFLAWNKAEGAPFVYQSRKCFGQWWKRVVRSSYAFAQGAYLHAASLERHRLRESRREWLWGVVLRVVCLAHAIRPWPLGLLAQLIYPIQILRQTGRNYGSLTDRATLTFFQILARFPESYRALI
jgi:hypothetical protein